MVSPVTLSVSLGGAEVTWVFGTPLHANEPLL